MTLASLSAITPVGVKWQCADLDFSWGFASVRYRLAEFYAVAGFRP